MMRDLAELWSKGGSDFLREKAAAIQAAADGTGPGPYKRTMEANANAWRRAWIAFEDAWREVLRPVELPRPVMDVTLKPERHASLASVKAWEGVPGHVQEQLKALALEAACLYPGLDIHIEAYPLREDARKTLEKT